MVIVKTRRGRGPGPKFLVDLRNGIIFEYRNDDWERLALKEPIYALVPNQPFVVKDLYGILDDLTVTDDIQEYHGPHPGGDLRCSCGAKRNKDGFCPRCHDKICHICGKPLNKQKLCNNAQHNPLQVPIGVTKPLGEEELKEYQAMLTQEKLAKAKWPDKFIKLSWEHRKVINRFFSNLCGSDHIDALNWADDVKLHRLPTFCKDFKEVKEHFKYAGELPGGK